MWKFKYDNEADIPADRKAHYVERDGAWFLNVEGAVEKRKLDEFRNNNLALFTALGVSNLEDAKKKLEKLKDVDPELYAKLSEEHKNAEQKKLETKGEYQKAIDAQRATMQAEFEKTKKKLEDDNAALKKRLEVVLIDDAVATAASKKGVRATAILDVKQRARGVFKLDGDAIKAYEGEAEKFGKDGSALKIDEWVESLVADAPHLFDPSQGTNSHGGGSAGGYSGRNPYDAATRNLTEQAKIERENPTLAKRLKDSAKIN